MGMVGDPNVQRQFKTASKKKTKKKPLMWSVDFIGTNRPQRMIPSKQLSV